MPATGRSHVPGRFSHSGYAATGGLLSSISYRSRATSPLSDVELNDLVRRAQLRNRAESITGMVIYDDGRFLQWLEGPPDALSRVMTSINRDARHSDIEVLGEQSTPFRMFEGWDLKLRRKFPARVESGRISDLFQAASTEPAPADVQTDEATVMVPAAAATIWVDTDAAIKRLAELLIDDTDRAHRMIEDMAAQSAMPRLLFARLFEPAARALGDLWADDRCTEFDVTIGLCHLQSAMRRLCHALGPARLPNAKSRTALIVPQPGEPHLLGAVLNAEMLWRAGWHTRPEFPDTDASLQDILASNWFDALALSLSPAVRRDHWLPRMAATITKARQASQNQALAIVASGRLFAENEDVAAALYIDARCRSSRDIEQVMDEALGRRRH